MYYSFKVQSPASTFFSYLMHKTKFAHNPDIFKRGPTARSPRHRALCGRRPAVLVGRILLPELMEEVVLLVRKEETRFHLKGKIKSDGLRNGASSGRHLHGLDGSSPSVLPQDLDGLVHRHADGETQQQAGSDCAAGEKQKSRRPCDPCDR